MPLTSYQRSAIRLDRQNMSAIEVARKYGISRARVYQISSDDPTTWKEPRSGTVAQRTGTAVFPGKLSRLNDPAVQQAICDSTESQAAIARSFGISEYAVGKIRYAHGAIRTGGRHSKKA